MTTPGPAVVAEVHRRLRAQQGRFIPKPVLPALDEVVATVLSQHTSDINSGRAFARLKEIFPNWEQVADAPTEDVADAIRPAASPTRKPGASSRSWRPSRSARAGSASTGWPNSMTRPQRPTWNRCPGSARRPRRACSCSPSGGPRSPSIPTCTASRSGWGGSRRRQPPMRHTGSSRRSSRRASATTCTSRWSLMAGQSAGRSGHAAISACCATCAPSAPPSGCPN